jgi:hypothetical protein
LNYINFCYVDKLFKFVLVAYTDKSGFFVIALQFKFVNAVPDPIIIPTTFNDDDENVVALLNMDVPETNKQ